MGAVTMVAQARRRTRWGATCALIALVGLAGGAVIAAVAGARRTDSALSRFEESARVATFEIDTGNPTATQQRTFARTPGIEAVGSLRQVALFEPDIGFLPVAAPVDGSWGHELDRRRLVRGRRAHGPLELNIGEGLVRRLGVDVGDRLTFSSFTQAQIDSGELEGGDLTAKGPEVELRIVGVVRHPLDLGVRGDAGGVVVLTRAFVEQYGDQIGSFSGLILRVRTANGEADARRISEAAQSAFGGDEEFRVQPLGIEGRSARNAANVAAAALWILAAVLTVAGAIAVGFTLARQAWADVDDQPVLRAIGMRRRQRWAATVALAVPIALGGALLAVVVGTLASPAFPVGVARAAEPNPGFHIDGVALGAGFVAVAGAVLGAASLAAWSMTRRLAERPPRSVLAGRVATASMLSPAAVAGIGFALERGRGRRSVPVWSSVTVMTMGVLGVVAALMFGAGLHHIAAEPPVYGWTWDVSAFGTDHIDEPCPSESVLTGAAGVGAVASLCYRDVSVAGNATLLWAFRPVRGEIAPRIVAGRQPRAANEIALGRDLLDAAGVGIGDRVRVATEGRSPTYVVVGQVVFPSLDDPVPLAGSAVTTPAGLARAGGAFDNQTVLRVRAEADIAKVQSLVARRFAAADAHVASVPAEIERLRQIDAIPGVLAVVTAVLGLGAVAFTLVLSVRRRARELALLKTLGFVRGQVRAAVAWQASTLAGVGLVVGGVLGLVVGRTVWRAVAEGLGIEKTVHLPCLPLALLVPVVLVLVNLVAAFPARTAAHTPPAVVLRSE